jgi:hypothetical protein
MAITFKGGVQVPTVFGNDALVQHVFSLENGIGSRVDINVRRLTVQNDPLVALTSVMPQVKISRGVNISGGVLLNKASFLTTQTSDPSVVIRSPLGEGSPIAATQGNTVWQQYVSRMHTAVEQVLASDENLLPRLVDSASFNFKLRPGESMLATVVSATVLTNAALSNNWLVDCAWEEDEIATFAISGTVTLSAVPVAGAIVTVIEADDNSMTNAVLRETIVTPAGGTWASSIRVGKVGAAFVQYESGGTLYTAPGSPYLA